jgi:hypothetical protein
LVLTSPMHWPTHGQWWSNFWTQLLQMEQCEDRGRRYLRQVSQNFIFTVKPFITASLVLIRGVLPPLQSIDGELDPRNSSASGGALVFLGTRPGSLADAMKRKTRSCICGPNEPWVLQFVLERQLEYSISKIGLIIISDIQVEISVESMMVA